VDQAGADHATAGPVSAAGEGAGKKTAMENRNDKDRVAKKRGANPDFRGKNVESRI
jgi:hypothetical protein